MFDNIKIVNNICKFDEGCDDKSKLESKDKIKLFVDNFVNSTSSIEFFHNFVSNKLG